MTEKINIEQRNGFLKNASTITLSMKIADLVIGYLKSNSNSPKKRKYQRWTNKYWLHLKESESVIPYKHIAEKVKCSISLVEKVVKRMILAGIIVRIRASAWQCWVISFSKHTKIQWLNFWFSFKGVRKDLYKDFQIIDQIIFDIPSYDYEIETIVVNNQDLNSDQTIDKIDWDDDD